MTKKKCSECEKELDFKDTIRFMIGQSTFFKHKFCSWKCVKKYVEDLI